MLSARESDYLTRIAAGWSVHDIALSDGIAVNEIAAHLNSASEKLGAGNLMDAIAKAMRLKLLPGSGRCDDGV
ncbi:LuxR C-terminal-related transcriptional regulator [Pararhizobium haloflavum]|uniref:LuxR C-terminal-related transcriptional regulator n=1 Tax=Pararhizobium haloflavum TaxID=2037914 RepID=UPI000C1A84EC|nr:LuxR C-terminal-related transcriptional regulator [Pararhizobium haloflavum]